MGDFSLQVQKLAGDIFVPRTSPDYRKYKDLLKSYDNSCYEKTKYNFHQVLRYQALFDESTTGLHLNVKKNDLFRKLPNGHHEVKIQVNMEQSTPDISLVQ